MDPRSLSPAVQILLVAVVYYVTARLSLQLSLVERNVTPVWPPTGIALVAFLVLGRRVWPGVAVAAFAINLPISENVLATAATAAGNTLAPLVAAELLHVVGFRLELDRVRDAVAIVFLAALASMLISATVGTVTLVVEGAIPTRDFLGAWAVWWAGDAMGVLVVAPFLLSLMRHGTRPATRWPRLEAAGLLVVLVAVSLVVTRTHLRLLFLVIPFVGWAAWRFQQRGSAPAALLVAGIASWAAAHSWGPFSTGTLFQKMLTLQAFNATVAFISFFFAALVTERLRAKEGLERAAAQLEERVRERTSELSAANDRLRQQGQQLAEAQQLARVGSWEWRVEEDRVTWSDEMYRIHGYRPQEFAVTFEKAVEQVDPRDLERIRANLGEALGATRDLNLPAIEYRINRTDGAGRVLLGKAKLKTRPVQRLVGTVQDITEEKNAEREHRIAETLQRSLLPDRMPEIPGVLLATRYVPASAEVEVGGDWYDVVQLPNGRVGVVIGDVAGHGLRAAATMGQLRMAIRAYSLEERSPARVVSRVHELVERLLMPDMATLVYLVFDPDSGDVTFANAGHPPPLVISTNGDVSFLEGGLAHPLGAVPTTHHYVDATAHLEPGSTLLLFTDGLVERRGVSLREGLARLKEQAAAAGPDLSALCDHLVEVMVGANVSDDIALLALRAVPFAGRPLHLHVPAEPNALAPLRHTVRRWLREAQAEGQEGYDILVACGEACSNALQHAYGAGSGFLDVDLAVDDGDVAITVRDWGTWRPPSKREGGRGLALIRGLMDSVDVDTGPEGTVVLMRRHLRVGTSEPAGTR